MIDSLVACVCERGRAYLKMMVLCYPTMMRQCVRCGAICGSHPRHQPGILCDGAHALTYSQQTPIVPYNGARHYHTPMCRRRSHLRSIWTVTKCAGQTRRG